MFNPLHIFRYIRERQEQKRQEQQDRESMQYFEWGWEAGIESFDKFARGQWEGADQVRVAYEDFIPREFRLSYITGYECGVEHLAIVRHTQYTEQQNDLEAIAKLETELSILD